MKRISTFVHSRKEAVKDCFALLVESEGEKYENCCGHFEHYPRVFGDRTG